MKLNESLDIYNIVSSFSQNPMYDFSIYAEGYRRAAKSLADKLRTQNHFADHDGYVSSPFLVHFKSRIIVSLFNCLVVPAVGRSGAKA